jgi:hypothetical protein
MTDLNIKVVNNNTKNFQNIIDIVDVIDVEASTNIPHKIVDNNPKRIKKRCYKCKKKIASFGAIVCKCNYEFCGKHRYADKHECTYNYKQYHRNKLIEMNPCIKMDKIKDRI